MTGMDDTEVDSTCGNESFLAPSPLYRHETLDSNVPADGSSWQDVILAELTAKAPGNAIAARLLDVIEELADALSQQSTSMTPASLCALISNAMELTQAAQQSPANDTDAKVFADALTIIAMQATRWVLRHALENHLDILVALWPDIEFWKGRLRVRKPLRDLLEQGPVRWFRSLFGFPPEPPSKPRSAVMFRGESEYPRLILRSFRTGIKPFISSVSLSGRIDIQAKVARLCDLKRKLLRRAGALHHHSFRLSRTQSSSIEEWLIPILDLYRMCIEADPPPNATTTNDALQMLVAILEALPAMRDRLEAERAELQRPGHLQRHWLGYTVGGIALLLAGRTVYMHRDWFENMYHKFAVAAKDFWVEHVSDPLHAIHKRLLRDQLPAMRRDEIEQERKTLESMLREFGMEQLDRNPQLFPPGMRREDAVAQIEKSAASGNMSLVLESYKTEVSKPLYALAAGDLLRSILIQLQKLKVDLETSLLELDLMLDQNEITLDLMAIAPAVLIAMPLFLLILIPANKRSKADTASHKVIRRSVHSIHRLLICNYDATSVNGFESIEDSGKILTHIHRISKRAQHLRNQKLMPYSSFFLLRKDIKRLISLDFTVNQKRLLIERMYVVHPFLTR
ncbi:unnamed protein product (mitochondrion) [Plasmodiophora brassicae]|uniref:Uncharacterized protein n=2 Tax=Plasmodiophora brassicae TaxID=37360 RepID=A0A3P3YCK5_PLABS|nr:unnamed protein product [Plasmodiophora brassicae]